MSLSPPQIKSWLPDRDPVVLTYFCHLSTSLSPKQLLSSLCREILRRYRRNASPLTQTLNRESPGCAGSDDEDAANPHLHRELSPAPAMPDCGENPNLMSFSAAELRKHFLSLLSLVPSTDRPLFLILDGLDHIENRLGSQVVGSLPSPLPPDVKVILSVSPGGRQILESLRPQRPGDSLLEATPGYVGVSLGMADRRGCLKMLASLLSGSGRKVTSGQQALVGQALTSCCLTLYVRLLHLHLSLWRSGRTQKTLANLLS